MLSNTLLIISDGMSNAEYKAIKYSNYLKNDWNIVSISYLDLIYLSDFFYEENILFSSLPELINSFLRNKEKISNDYEFIYKNKYLDFQFKGIELELTRSIKLSQIFSVFLDLLNPSVVFFGHDAFTTERILVGLAKSKEILTIGLLHSGLGLKYGYRGIVGDVDYILVWNNVDKEFLSDYGLDKSKIIIIGSLSYDMEYHNYLLKRNKIKILNKNKNQILILTSSINSGFSAPIASQTEHLKLINELVVFMNRRKDLFFVIKAHPSFDHYELYRQINDKKLNNFLFDENLTLSQAIKNSRLCILLNYFTTAAIDAMLNFKPILFLDNAIYDLPNWKTTNDQNNFIQKIDNIHSLEFFIDKILTDVTFVDLKLASANKLLDLILGDTKNKALYNLEDFIKYQFNKKSIVKSLDLKHYKSLYSNSLKSESFENENNLIPIYIYIYAALDVKTYILFSNKLFRFNQKHHKFKYSLLLKHYIYGSNAGNSKEDFKSFFYLFALLIYNLDLLFKKSFLINRDLHKYIYRQIIR
jgi:hypothetical protein